MSACPVCGAALSEDRPRYCAILETSGTTRSARTETSGESDEDDMTGRLHRQLCPDCWEDLYGSLTDNDRPRW